MSKLNPFALVDMTEAIKQSKKQRSTIWKHIAQGRFPPPLAGGNARACWLQIQITNYLYQVAKYGQWEPDRADEALEIAYKKVLVADSSLNNLENRNGE